MTAYDFALPPAEFMRMVGSNYDDFHKIGRDLCRMIIQKCDLKPSCHVLDIGSGCGRVAIHFTDYLSKDGAYDGFDVVLPMVEWCQEHITTIFPNFKFGHAHLTNTAYSDVGGDPSTYDFPYPANRFDAVYATSLFTHLVPSSANQYAAEIERVLKPGQKAFLTFYIINDDFRCQRNSNEKLPFLFTYERDGYALHDESRPEAVLAFEEYRARKMLEDTGLVIEALSYGSWRKPGGWRFQDVFLVSKKRN